MSADQDAPSTRDDYLRLYRESGVSDPTTEEAEKLAESLGWEFWRIDRAVSAGLSAGYFRLRDY